MPRPSTRHQRRAELLPLIAEVFGELGYRRATTAEIAARCGIQESILCRVWGDKKAMFLAVVGYLLGPAWGMKKTCLLLKAAPEEEDYLFELFENTSRMIGNGVLLRIISAALGEVDDVEIMSAVRELCHKIYEAIRILLDESDGGQGPPHPATEEDAAWAIMGLVTMLSLAGELKLLDPHQQTQIFKRTARALLGSADEGGVLEELGHFLFGRTPRVP